MRHAIIVASLLFGACATDAGDSDFLNPETGIETHADGKADGESCDFTSLEGLYDAFGYRAIPHDDGTNSYRIGLSWDTRIISRTATPRTSRCTCCRTTA